MPFHPRIALSFLVALACLVCVLLPTSAAGSESLRVRVQRPLEDDALIEEAVVRAMGELSALGFDVEVLRRRTTSGDVGSAPALDPGTEGALVFARNGDQVVVSAWVSNGRHAFVQSFDETDPNTSAEVIAVSAVEALRGILIASGASGPETPGPTEPPATSANNQLPPEPRPTPGLTSNPDDSTSPSSSGEGRAIALSTFIAPSIGLESTAFETLGLGGAVLVSMDSFGVGAGFDQVLLSGTVRDAAGSATVKRQRIVGILRGQLDLTSAVQGFAELQAGAANYEVQATAAPGFASENREHADFVAGLGLGATYWLFDAFGAFATVEAFVLPRPIHVRMEGRRVATLGAPSTSLGIGVAARYH